MSIAPEREWQVAPIAIGKLDVAALQKRHGTHRFATLLECIGGHNARSPHRGWVRTHTFASDGVRAAVTFQRPKTPQDRLRLKHMRKGIFSFLPWFCSGFSDFDQTKAFLQRQHPPPQPQGLCLFFGFIGVF